jgi:hypothetical protein
MKTAAEIAVEMAKKRKEREEQEAEAAKWKPITLPRKE